MPVLEALSGWLGKGNQRVTPEDVGWVIGPLLNAPGRMGRGKVTLELLTSKTVAAARREIPRLESLNARRRRIQKEVLDDACKVARVEIDRDDPDVLVLWGDWHLGVLGIAASNMSRMYQRPVILFKETPRESRGSGRTYGDIDLHDTIHGIVHQTHFVGPAPVVRYGGHPAAIGLTVKTKDLPLIRGRLKGKDRGGARTITKPILYDADVPLSQVDATLISEVSVLAPFGRGNPEPVFLADGVTVLASSSSYMGAEGFILQGDKPMRFISRSSATGLPKKTLLTILYTPILEVVGGKNRIVLKILDYKI
jgi:single-stranded-DNA-specific exonuclease